MMKIKRFFAPDIRQAMRMVKDELGSDAVIMSNKSVESGVEIFAARDFDPQVLHQKVEEESLRATGQEVGKLFELPDYAAEKKSLHIIPSARKQDALQDKASSRSRRNVDSYMGYAEKSPLIRQKPQEVEAPIKTIAKKTFKTPVPDVKVFEDQCSPSKIAEQAPLMPNAVKLPVADLVDIAQNQTVATDLLTEMRNEFQQLKLSMSARLSEIGFASTLNSNPVRLNLLHRLADMGISEKIKLKISQSSGRGKVS